MNFNQLKDAFPSTIARMKDSFDTHAFVLMLAKHHQRAYVQALADQDSETPFHNLHKLIGKALSRSGLLEKTAKPPALTSSVGRNRRCSAGSRCPFRERLLMERNGYTLDQTGVGLRVKTLFKTAAR